MKIVCFSIEFSTFCQSNPFWLWCLGVALPHCRRRLLLYYTRLLPALGRLLPAFGSVLCCCELKGWYENDIRYNPSCKICSSDLLSDSVESGCTWQASVLHGPINCIVKMYHKLYQPYQYCYEIYSEPIHWSCWFDPKVLDSSFCKKMFGETSVKWDVHVFQIH